MYLEKLELQGFKSFANKNKLVFSGLLADKKRGITVVVGPNGSGKSNIADSIRWALGEQSTKLLRSKKSEDVIFSGSDKKNRLNMAEVSLYFNNEQGILNSNVSEIIDPENNIQGNQESDNIDALLLLPEIILTRRIFRDGNSEYYINNIKVRLSDVQIFLAKANFGQKTYSVIGQGMVENFLNTSPAERKVFFDEATGVKQYQIKRDLSLNKLENSQENLSKVEMLLNEIEPRLKSLTRQVNKLKKRQFLEEELLKNQLNYYNKIWKEISCRLYEFQGNIDKLENNKTNLEKNIEEKKKKLEIINQGETIGEEFYELQKRFLFLKGEQNRATKQIEKISLYHQTKKENDKNVNSNFLNSLNLEKNNLIKEIEEINKKSEELKHNSFNIEELKKLEAELNFLERENNNEKQKLLKIEAWLEVKFEKQGKFDLSFLINREIELKTVRGELNNDINTLFNSIKKTESKIENLQVLKNEAEKQLSDLNKELDKVITNSGLFDSNKINQGLEKLIDKIEKNKDLEDFSLFKKIIDEIKDEIKSLLKISSGEDYNFKIKSLNKKITELKEEIKNIDNNIMAENIECNSAKNKKNNLEESLRKFEQELKSIEERIKQNENIDQSNDNTKNKKEIENEIKNNEAKIIELQNKIFSLQSDRDNKQEQKFKIQEELQKKQNKLNEINNDINSLKSDSIKIQSRLEDLEQEIKNNIFSNIESEIFEEFIIKEKRFVENFQTENDKEIAILQAKIDNFNQEQENKKRELIELQRDIKELEIEMENLNNSLNDNKINLTREETRIEELQNNIENDKLNLEKIKKHSCLEEFDVNIIREEIGRLKNQLELIGGIDPETEKEYEETKKRFDFLFDQTEDLNKTIKSLEKVIIELDALIKEKFESEFKVISEKFNEYFKILFNGGNAKIFPVKDEIVDEDKETENKDQTIKNNQSFKNIKLIKRLKKYNAVGLSGIDISATPPGKKISSVNMLSGGERALTAIALICAIISANPSPFVVLDEVDASLDESNSERLAKILDDLSNKTQFIAISHNRATMKKANILYGVTMQRDGISKLLSVKLDEYKS
jgi:chromosome segregation protein